MKAFEEWNKPRRINDLALNGKLSAKHKEQERLKGWRAAFEHLKDVIDNDKIDSINDGSWLLQQCREKIVEFIDAELES